VSNRLKRLLVRNYRWRLLAFPQFNEEQDLDPLSMLLHPHVETNTPPRTSTIPFLKGPVDPTFSLPVRHGLPFIIEFLTPG
jgi:hypothetical protein